MRIRTYAKINLFLRVLGRRADGYHEIETIFHGVGLHDDIEFEIDDGPGVRLEVRAAGQLACHLPTMDDNLIVRAARLIAPHGHRPGVKVTLHKRVPVGAGLGGGSANAAGALRAFDGLWGCGLDDDALRFAAASLGSDVAYCLNGGTMLGIARGEQLTPLATSTRLWFVLGISHEPLMTADVYEQWQRAATSEVNSASLTLALGAGDVAEVAELLHNELEPAVFTLRPELKDGKAILTRAGALGALVSGSGPTLFGIAGDEEHAHSIASKVRGRFDRIEVVCSQAPCIVPLD